ncbi:envelope glycoprotein UL130 [Panine betaherpesvirus 2]|uniref:Envelope glycoprotein UL130 n=1 Tax=Panine betaherpesvirus 2 TaxID=188763 RepID=Q8QRY3_9BETA|nr:envelope glycoprotein UL130 [Panine betaherpesvirus 2]AAM00755.1 envelope glycoprotein UL130 [Panine betaherpesvirus 2]QXV67868.1 envelope glycoprotein UL130 [Panine betaherpesvirus 2]
MHLRCCRRYCHRRRARDPLTLLLSCAFFLSFLPLTSAECDEDRSPPKSTAASSWSQLTLQEASSPSSWSAFTAYLKTQQAASLYCPLTFPSPPRRLSEFTRYHEVPGGPSCNNETLVLLYNRDGQTLIERPSPWVKKVTWYLSGRDHPVFQRFAKTASTANDGNVQIRTDDAKVFGSHMVPKQTKLLRFVINDGTRYEMCIMKLETWAHVFRDYSVAFQTRLTFTQANNQTYSYCTHPNLLV